MNNALISVVVPNYNNAKYLNECILSIVNQTHTNIEIIILDDKSSDESRDVISKIAENDSRVVPVFNKRNIGISGNRHNGVMLASGKYITTLDADDYLLDKRKLEKECELMDEYTDKNIIAFSKFSLVDESGVKYEKQPVQEIREGDILSCVFTRTCMIPRDYMFTKCQYINSGGFDPKVKIYEDWDLKIRMSEKYDFHYSGIDGIAYRRHGKGLSALRNPYHYRWLTYIYRKNISMLKGEASSIVENKFNEYLKENFSVRDKLLSYLIWQ